MIEIGKLVSLLWKPFIREINSGGPTFFCFYSDLLSSEFLQAGFNVSDSAQLINEAAKMFLVVDGGDVELKAEALIPNESGFSAAIVLVCQQVLAVEEMVRDESGYSEHAYFPRLRRMISSDLSELSINPFSFDEFERIWRRLAQEVRSVRGSSEVSITFQFGVEQGVNKARSFPLSQALFSQDDLNLLVRRIGVERLRKADSISLWALLRSERTQLKRRAQRLMSLTFLRDRIIAQTRSFAENVDQSKIQNIESLTETLPNSELRFYKDTLDWNTDEFRAYLTRTDSGERIDEEAAIRSELNKEINKRGLLILPPGNLGDSWIKTNSDIQIGPGDTFIFVGSKTEIGRGLKLITNLVPALVTSITKSSQYPFSGEIIVQECVWPNDIVGQITIRAGAISERSREISLRQVEWLGGICIDRRSDKFLRGSLPEHIRFETETIPSSSATKINDRFVSWKTFIESIEELVTDQSYEVSFPNGKRAKLGVAVCRSDPNDRMGYMFDGKGKLLPVIDRVTPSSNAVVGFEEPEITHPLVLRPHLCAELLNELQRKIGRRLMQSEIKIIYSGVRFAKIPNEVKVVIEKLLLREPSLSEDFLGKLELGV